MHDMSDESFYSVVGYQDNGFQENIISHVSFLEALESVQSQGSRYKQFNIIEERSIPAIPNNLFVVSDTNCLYEETKELFYRPAKLNETFVFLGNYIGKRGFLRYMKYLTNLKKKRPCVFVRGRNEHNILEYIHGTERYIGSNHDVFPLIHGIEKELGYSLKDLPDKKFDYYKIIETSIDYFENDRYIFTSGGVDLTIPYWKQSSQESLYTTTDDFLRLRNITGKKIVFGDRPTEQLAGEHIYGLWMNKAQDKIGINGNATQHGKLLGFSVLNNDINYFTVRSKAGREERQLCRREEMPEDV